MEKTEAIKLLAIDDKPDNLTTLSAVVRDALPQTLVLTATNGPTGIELAAAEDPDVILLDIVMPGMDGFAVCRRLKADDRIRDIPVVFLTALKTDAASRVKALEVGCEGFLSKPLEPAELTAQIRAMTKVKTANRSQRTEKDRLEALLAERTRMVRESELRYRAMFENMAAASCVDEIVYKDGRAVDYRILDVNPAFERITGIRRQEAVGALASALYGLGQAPFLDVYGRVAETGEPAEFEAWLEPIQKHLFVTVGCPKPGFFSTVFTDITERKQIAEMLKRSKELLAETERIGKVGGWSVNIDTMKQTWTDEVYRIHEVEIGPHPSAGEGIDYYTKESRPIIEKAWQRAIELGEDYDLELEIITAKGNTRAVHTIGKADLQNRRIYGFFQDITERKRSEEALRQSEEKFRLIVDNSSDLIWILKPDGVFSYVSPAWELILGYEPSYMEGKAFQPFVHPEDVQACEDYLREAIDVRASLPVIQYRTKHADGSWRWHEGTISPVYADDGSLMHFVVVSRDITERKRAEAKSLELRMAVEQSGDGIALADMDGHIIFVNKVWAAMHGYAAEELIGRHLSMFHTPEQLEKEVIPFNERLIATGAETGEMGHCRKDGTTFPTHMTVTVAKDATGTPFRLLAAAHDITERKRAEEALMASEGKLRSIFASMTEMVVLHELVCDEDGKPLDYRILDCNPAFTQITGIRRDDAMGRLATDVYGSDTAPYLDEYARVALTGEPCAFIAAYAPMDKHFDIQASSPGKNRFVTVTTDITEQKQTEAKLVASEDRFSRAIAGTGAGLWDWDMVKNTVFFSRQWKSMLGYADHEVENDFTGWKNLWHPEDAARIEKAVSDYIEGRTTAYEVENRLRHKDGSWHWILTRGDIERDAAGNPVRWTGTNIDITAHKQAEEALRENEARFRSYIEQSPYGIFVTDGQGRYVDANPAAERITGYSAAQLTSKHVSDLLPPASRETGLKHFHTLVATGASIGDMAFLRADGSLRYWFVSETRIGPDRYLGFVEDITERKRAETYREMGREVLQILNEPGDLQESIQSILTALKTRTGCDAVGLRLQEGDDFPYFAQDGFAQDFLLTENTLVERGKDGGVCRDKDGNVCLECTCGLVISGKTDPANPLFTKGGSCWTNDSFPLLDLPSDQDPRLHPRNTCIHHGYASVALIPVRNRERIVGLIQLNDKRKGRFALETIEILEGIAAHIGSALMRKRAEDELRESKNLYERLAAESRTIAWTADTAGLYTYVSPMIEDVLGYRQEEIVGKLHVYDLHPEEGREAFKEEVFATTRRKEATVNLDNELVCKDGSVVWVTTNARPILDADGSLKGYRGSDKDITEHKHAAQELVRLSTAIEQAGEAVMITDAQGTIQYANPAFEEVSGYSREETIGQNPRLLKSGQQDRAFYRDLWATIAEGRVWKGRMVNKRKDGTFYTDEATISPVKDASGRIRNYVAVKRDITEFLRIEEERAKLQEQFQHAQKIESIGRLAGGIAHDFNNMLSIILGFGQLVLDELRQGDPLQGWVKEIMTAGQRSKALTRQLLAFSRKQALQPEVLDLNHLVRELEKMLYRLIGEDITLELALAQDIGRVLVDPGQIEQMIVNLAVNARDAMPTGGRLLIETTAVELDDTCTETHPESKSGKYVLLAVTDTGCGMSEEILSQIFEPFFTTKEKYRGTGLGLATVYGIVKQSGGNIWVDSEPGQGTTFKIYLPQTQAVEESAVAKPEAAVPVAGGEHILVVEDEEMLRKLMASLLSRLGYIVTLAANGGEALLLVEEKGLMPDLIITDVVMPNMSGKQLIDRLRRNHPHLKTLYMSGYTDDAIFHHGVLDAGTPFIQKPFHIQDLGAKVQDVLRGGRAFE